jgi:hypothetical protein
VALSAARECGGLVAGTSGRFRVQFSGRRPAVLTDFSWGFMVFGSSYVILRFFGFVGFSWLFVVFLNLSM